MSAVSSGDGGQDVDLNLAPIIDCFTVLITYLLVSASFISLSVIDVGVAATGQGAAANPNAVPPVSVTINLQVAKSFEIKVSGGPQKLQQSFVIPASEGGDWDLAAITKKLKAVQHGPNAIKDITVTAEPAVKYRELVRLIETVKKEIPKVFVSG